MNKKFWDNLPRPIVMLAPMDGYTDSAMRRICKEINPEIITVTEFTSADGLAYGAKKLQQKVSFNPSEQPVIAQIFGKDPIKFAEASKWLEQAGFAGIDLNMGCPSKKVVKSEHGIALRKCPTLAFQLIESVVNATKLPVSVKTRLGLNSFEDLIAFGKGVENAGANLITIHGRTYSVPYGCPANFEPIYELKRNLKIPVIGNGGITSIADGQSKLGNLDGFMIGQAAFGNPWVFCTTGAPATFAEKIPVIVRHLGYMIEHKGSRVALLEIRKHLLAYAKGLPNATAYRSRLARVESIDQAQEILKEIAETN